MKRVVAAMWVPQHNNCCICWCIHMLSQANEYEEMLAFVMKQNQCELCKESMDQTCLYTLIWKLAHSLHVRTSQQSNKVRGMTSSPSHYLYRQP